MPYGVTDEQWSAMNDYGRYLAKQAWEKKQKSSTTTQQSASIPQSTWEQMPAKPYPEAAEHLIVQQPFDPYRYIKELQDAARSKPTKELRAAMAKELSRID